MPSRDSSTAMCWKCVDLLRVDQAEHRADTALRVLVGDLAVGQQLDLLQLLLQRHLGQQLVHPLLDGWVGSRPYLLPSRHLALRRRGNHRARHGRGERECHRTDDCPASQSWIHEPISSSSPGAHGPTLVSGCELGRHHGEVWGTGLHDEAAGLLGPVRRGLGTARGERGLHAVRQVPDRRDPSSTVAGPAPARPCSQVVGRRGTCLRPSRSGSPRPERSRTWQQ